MSVLLFGAWVAVAAAQPFSDQSTSLGTALSQSEPPPPGEEGQLLERYRPYSGGAAVGDYDGDGDVDIFYTRFGAEDVLFENQGDGTFVDVAALVGLDEGAYSNGAAFVDVDNDGDLDLVVTRAVVGAHALFLNDGITHLDTGRPAFADFASERGLSFVSVPGREVVGQSIAAGDFDRDGWPDLYVTEWVGEVASCGTEHSRLLRNRGASTPGYFEDSTVTSGVIISSASRPESWTLPIADMNVPSQVSEMFT